MYAGGRQVVPWVSSPAICPLWTMADAVTDGPVCKEHGKSPLSKILLFLKANLDKREIIL